MSAAPLAFTVCAGHPADALTITRLSASTATNFLPVIVDTVPTSATWNVLARFCVSEPTGVAEATLMARFDVPTLTLYLGTGNARIADSADVTAVLPIVALMVIAVWLLGVGTLMDLALVQFVGVIVGTYSSIFFATPLLGIT